MEIALEVFKNLGAFLPFFLWRQVSWQEQPRTVALALEGCSQRKDSCTLYLCILITFASLASVGSYIFHSFITAIGRPSMRQSSKRVQRNLGDGEDNTTYEQIQVLGTSRYAT